ncbi:hypothetical protein ACFQY4_38565 [Catellatospora bangladeshensis]|uniref:NurA domain-containing protein n=1 Tax=Catellatospora bangladeshensis TaxID=310355 RepID=A0A8J3JVU9_9ACTN|nr:hypothetical protein [Catellatospora bangladeshensis]GIF84024.1 hypothetical protein Cba03nite_53730 [Catellatospora bangladeshensis]
MKFHVDAWDPGFGASIEGSDRGPAEASSAKLDPEIELPSASWRPLDTPPGVRAPDVVLLVDGVRRTDARLWIEDHDGATRPGLASSYAAGVVRCERSTGASVTGVKVERTLFTAAEQPTDVDAGQAARYRAETVLNADEKDLSNRLQGALTELEIEVSRQLREDGDLLIVDGPLRSRDALPRTLGYIKTQQKQYLPERLIGVVAALQAGQRTPLFRITGVYERLTWYLRLPHGGTSPWAGVVRVECSAEVPEHQAVALADLSTATIPRFASLPYKDPRAPQNLVPIAGLEKKLRHLLGDGKLLHRALALAAHRTAA